MTNVDEFLARKRAERAAAGIVERPTIILPVEGEMPVKPAPVAPSLVRYEPHEDAEEDNRRRRAAGMPERKGKWGTR